MSKSVQCHQIHYSSGRETSPFVGFWYCYNTMQNITVPACPERLLVLWICSCMLYSSEHMAGHQGLINSDVSFNNTLLFSWCTVTEIQEYTDQKLIAQTVVYIQEKKVAIIPNVLTK